jgi:hypothetical protein
MNVIPAIAASKTEDQEIARRWVAAHFSETDTAQIPFSFVYGGKSSRELLPNWKLQKQEKTLDGGRKEITLTFAEPGPGLEVRVVAASPGPVITEAYKEVLGISDKLDELVRTIPLGRAGDPDDIAAMVLFLCSPAASWITGEHHLVAGGRTTRSYQYRSRNAEST